MFDTKTRLSLDLTGKKLRLDLNFGGKAAAGHRQPQEQEEGSFYGVVLDDETVLEDAVDFFSLPTPDVMKTFPGQYLNLKTPTPVSTPSFEGNNFNAEETVLQIPARSGEPTLDRFLATPTKLQPGDSLSTPVIDPNNQRPSLNGHIYGIAPSLGSADMSLVCASPNEIFNNQHHQIHAVPQMHRTPTPSDYPQDGEITLQVPVSITSSSFPASVICNAPAAPDSYFTELKPRSKSEPSAPSDLMPTVIDHIYCNNQPSSPASSFLSASPAPSSASLPANKSYSKKRKADQPKGTTKKARMTKKQQFLELQSKEQWLDAENEYLKRQILNIGNAVKNLKARVVEVMQKRT